MKIFGSISELVDLAFRLAGGKQVRLLSKTQTATDDVIIARIPDVAATGSDQEILLEKATQTILNKTLTSPVINGGTINSAVIGGSIPDAGTFTDIGGSTLDISGLASVNSFQVDGFSTAGILHNDANGDVSSSLIVDADVDDEAQITLDKLQDVLSNQLLIGDGAGDIAAVSVKAGSDISFSYDAGEVDVQINAGSVGNSELAEDVLRSKLAPGTAYRILANDGSGEISENAALTPDELVVTDVNGQLTTVSGVDSTELSYLNGLTSNVQDQIDAKEDTIIGAASTITGDNLTINRALISNGSGKVAVSAVTSTELGYLDGVSSNIQSQLNAKVDENAAITPGTFPKITFDAKGLVTSGSILSASDMPSGIDSARIANGSVSNTEFQYLNGVTSSIQTQLNGKVDENASITPGTFPKISYDAKGLVTSGSALSASDMPSAINAAKISTGVVSNTEFNYLNGVTSAIQTQLDGKLSSADAVTISDSQTITGAKIFREDVSIENGKKLKFYEPDGNGNSFISFRTAGILASTEYVLPSSDGVAGNVLGTDGAGNLQWQGAGALPDTVANQALVIGQTGDTYGTFNKGANNEVLTVNGSGNLEYVFLTNDNISGSAGISYSKLSLSNSIVNADIASAAAISGTKISPNFGAQNIVTTGSISAANGTISGTLDVRGAIDLADNDILRFGSGDDAEFFHNGTNLYLDLNVGDFIIRDGTTNRFTFDDAGSFTATGNIVAQGRMTADQITLGEQGDATNEAVRADRTISSGDGLSGGGNLTANRTLSVDSTVARTNAAETFSSSVTAASFSGNGSSLTNLNASNLSSGTVPSARLPEATSSALGAVYRLGAQTKLTETTSNTIAITKTGWYYCTVSGYIDYYNSGTVRAASLRFTVDGSVPSSSPQANYNSTIGGSTNWASPYLSGPMYLESGQSLSFSASSLGSFRNFVLTAIPMN